MTTAATDEHPADQTGASNVVASDLPCPCGYNLRGLPKGGRCPECGGNVAAAIRWQQHGFGSATAMRRMVLGLAIVLAAHLAWGLVLTYRGLSERVDRPAFWLTAASGPKTFIGPAAFFVPGSGLVANLAIPLCHAAQLLGLWLFTTPHATGRASVVVARGLLLRWGGLITFVGAFAAYPFWANRYMPALGATSLGDAVVGALWGIYLAGLARILNVTWMRRGAWTVAVGSLMAGGTFAVVFLFMTQNTRHWETILWTSLIAWSGAGLLCSILLALLWLRLRRERSAIADSGAGTV